VVVRGLLDMQVSYDVVGGIMLEWVDGGNVVGVFSVDLCSS